MVNKCSEVKPNQSENSNEYESAKDIIFSNPTEIDAIKQLNQYSEEDKIESPISIRFHDYSQDRAFK